MSFHSFFLFDKYNIAKAGNWHTQLSTFYQSRDIFISWISNELDPLPKFSLETQCLRFANLYADSVLVLAHWQDGMLLPPSADHSKSRTFPKIVESSQLQFFCLFSFDLPHKTECCIYISRPFPIFSPPFFQFFTLIWRDGSGTNCH